MPEGDTVWRTARKLSDSLSGRVLTKSDFRVPEFATVDLAGRTVIETVPRGKHLLTRVDGDTPLTIHTHLKMEGVWHVYQAQARWKRRAFEARIVLHTSTHEAVGFALGIVELIPSEREDQVVGHLGPDLLSDQWNLEEAVARVEKHPDVAIASALLDQSLVAGLGNVYVNELCFLHGVDPRNPVASVARLRRLLARAHQAINANKTRSERTLTGDLRPGHRTWVYGRGGQPCRRCGTRIQTLRIGPALQERDTAWCPHCQPPPGA